MAMRFASEAQPRDQIILCCAGPSNWGTPPQLGWPTNVQICYHAVSDKDLPKQLSLHPSAQHGELLDFVISKHDELETPFIVMDPDFLILSRDGIRLALSALSDDVDTIGVTYAVSRSRGLYTDFPVVYFQAFKSRDNLVFSPLSSASLPGEASRQFAQVLSRITLAIESLVNRIEGSLLRITWTRGLFAQIVRLPLEVMSGDPDKTLDTGFRNRLTIGVERSSVFDLVQRTSLPIPGTNLQALVDFNPELDGVPTEILGWYALRHGSLEKRNMSYQPLALRILAKAPMAGRRQGKPVRVQSLDGLVCKPKLLPRINALLGMGVDFYASNQVLFGCHLGSRSKARALKKFRSVGKLEVELSELRSSWKQ